ncbi:MAG: peptidoglycan DD-metalloendopeptidase family protein [Taibaiella sp.]|jgi:murein DD-endopeptidase MepM/ murein hydrolase activator NlpD
MDYGLSRRNIFSKPSKKPYSKWMGLTLVALVGGLIIQSTFSQNDLVETQVAQDVEIKIEQLVENAAVTAPTPAPIPAPAPKAIPAERNITVSIKPGDTLGKIFEKQGFDAAVLHNLVDNETVNHTLTNIHPGQKLDFTINPKNELIGLEYNANELERLVVTIKDGKTFADLKTRDVEELLTFADVTIEDSLFMDGEREGIDYNITMALAEIFSYDIDFALDIQQGDKFSVIYEDRYIDGVKSTPGNIIAAEFVNQGKTYQAVRFEAADGSAEYYTPNGQTLRKPFLRTPVEFARISSKFNPRRLHPVLHTIRAHKGVDYAAPIGTPVRASGDGVISLAETQRGYGKVIEIQHGSSYSTLYAHLNGFASGMKNGAKVKQGQIIGYVGKTGLVTGAHLHYEFRVNGVHVDPLTVKLPNSQPIDSRHKSQFLAYAKDVMNQLSNYQSIQLAETKVNPKQGA